MPIKLNDIVVFTTKEHPKLIKRVTKIEEKGYWLEGTSPYSKDSRDFGFVERKSLKYKLLF